MQPHPVSLDEITRVLNESKKPVTIRVVPVTTQDGNSIKVIKFFSKREDTRNFSIT